MKSLFSEIPYMIGKRVVLRALTPQDADALHELTDDGEVYRYLPTFLFEKKYDTTEEVISRLYDECIKDSLILGVFMEERFCGLAEVYGYRPAIRKVSIGCRLVRSAWGNHLAADVLRLLLDYLIYETDIEVITASTMTDNSMSPDSLEKIGFKRVAHGVKEDWGFDEKVKADVWMRSGIRYRHQNRKK